MILGSISFEIIEPLGWVLSQPYEAVSERIRTGISWTKYLKSKVVSGVKQMVIWPGPLPTREV